MYLKNTVISEDLDAYKVWESITAKFQTGEPINGGDGIFQWHGWNGKGHTVSSESEGSYQNALLKRLFFGYHYLAVTNIG